MGTHSLDPEAAFVATLRRFVALAAPRARRDDWLPELLSHPAYPGLQAVLDATRAAGVECAAVRSADCKLADVPAPALLQLRNASGGFAVFESLEGRRATMTHPDSRRRTVDAAEVESTWSGVAVVVVERKDPVRRPPRLALTPPGIAAALIVAAVVAATAARAADGLLLSLLFLQALGLAAAAFVSSAHHSAATGISPCPAGGAFDCSAVLTSRFAKVAGLPLADWAVAYFSATFLALAAGAAMGDGPRVIATWSFAATPLAAVAVASVLYQALALRAWCAGCLAIDVVLVVDALLARRAAGSFDAGAARLLLLSLFVTTAVIVALEDARRAAERPWEWRHARLKANPAVVAALLNTSRIVPAPPANAGVTAGAERDAVLEVIVVTSPYCFGCAASHDDVLAFAQKPGVRVTFLFLVGTNDEGPGTRAIAAAEGLARSGERESALALLHDWFAALAARRLLDAGTIESTAASGDVAAARHALEEEQKWAVAAGVRSTPAVFINLRALPPQLSIGDLLRVDAIQLARFVPRISGSAVSAAAASSVVR